MPPWAPGRKLGFKKTKQNRVASWPAPPTVDHGTCGLAVLWEGARLDKTSLSSIVWRERRTKAPLPTGPSFLPPSEGEGASDGRGFTVLRRGFRPSSRSLRNGGNLFSLARACAEASHRESRGCNCAGCARAPIIFHGVGPRPSFGLLTILAATFSGSA